MQSITTHLARPRKRALHLLIAALAGMAVATAAACSSSSSSTPTPSQSAAATSAATQQASASTAVVAVKQLPSLGAVLTSPSGMTLYVFKKDTNGQSNCSGACAQTWPPLTTTASSVPPVAGASGSFSIVKRSDGSSQVAYNGAPLYTYKGDTKPGDATGQGFGGVWYVASVSGAPSASPSASGSATATGSYSGY